MRNGERIAEELRILRAARDRRLTIDGHGRWVILGEPRPAVLARTYLVATERIWLGSSLLEMPASITDKGRAMLAAHEDGTL